MRVLIVSHYFPPEVGAPQARLHDFARAWAKSEDVTVLTGFPNHPTGIIPDEYRGKIRMREERDGYRIVRTWLYATPNEGIVRKTLGHLSFMVSSVVLGASATGPADVVVVSSPTFFSIVSAWLIARLKRARFVVEVRDLWPAIFVELGVLKNRSLIRLLEWMELGFYRAADAVVVVSEGFREDIVRRGISPQKVHFIPNGVEAERFDVPASASLRERFGARPNDVLVLYAGAHGISQALDTVVDSASCLRDQPVRFVLIGEGAAKADLEERVRGNDVRNLTMLPAVGRDEMPAVLASADICLAPLRDVPLFQTFIPSKIFEYMAAKRPIIGALSGEAARILSDAGAVVVPPEDVAALAAAITGLAANADLRAEMGRTEHAYVVANFDRHALAERYRLLLSTITA